jgi:hypothetical protein
VILDHDVKKKPISTAEAGRRGGRARSKVMSREERRRIATVAANARWLMEREAKKKTEASR